MNNKLNKSRQECPPVTIYFLAQDTTGDLYSISCLFCKRTITDRVKGTIDYAITSPMPSDDYDTQLNIMCKLCKQNYRFVTTASN